VTANPGCILQIQAGLGAHESPVRVMHLVEILDARLRRSGGSAMSRPRQHAARAQSHRAHSIGCWILTVSDTKTPETDTSGQLIRKLLVDAGHQVVGSAIVRDEPKDVQRMIREACANDEVRAVLVTGGTGITSRDSTYEAIEELLDKRLPGFGELFRLLSLRGDRGRRHDVARPARRARAPHRRLDAWLANACRLALEKLIIPELSHLIREVSR